MREIDFLPDWYKYGRVQRQKHREFYIALALIMFVMAAWSVFANSRVAAAKARNTALQNSKLIQVRAKSEYDVTQNQLCRLQSEQQMLDSVNSRIVVSNVISEMSHLLSGRVVLKKFEIKKEPFGEQSRKTGIRVVSAEADKSNFFGNETRFKITLGGLAADAAEVAEMINRIEQSDYFFQVIPGFSRNANVDRRQVCEFELTCYLSNYIMK